VLRTRILTAAVALPTVLAIVLFFPNPLFTLFIASIGAWALYEVAGMTRARSFAEISLLVVTGGVPLIGLLATNHPYPGAAGAVGVAMLLLIVHVAEKGPESGPHGAPLTLLGAVYVGALYPYFALLRNGPNGIALIVAMLLLVVVTDSGAYFTGRSIGKHKLMPKVSPNKTIEGAVGGIVSCLVAGLMLKPMLLADWTIDRVIVMSTIVSILAQIGDLAGSALKRASGVKDSGWIFPGHGGLIDRTCSLVFAAAFTYYYAG